MKKFKTIRIIKEIMKIHKIKKSIFFNIYKMFKVSAETYKNCGIDAIIYI